jgi:hypothetical protein
MADDDSWGSLGDLADIKELDIPDKQQFFSDKDFEKALESKQRKKKRDNSIPKGENYRQSDETDTIINTNKELPILLVPLNLEINENSIIPAGHYQVLGEKENGKPVLKLYQAHTLVAKLPAIETSDDFNEKYINFVNLKEYNSHQAKIIFGCLDFNAYTVVNFVQ